MDYVQRFEVMAQMRADGKTDQEISETFGNISRERVRQILLPVPRPVRRRKQRQAMQFYECSICGERVRHGWNGNRTKLHLCQKHSVLRSGLWRLIDDNYFDRHRRLVQRSAGHPDPTYTGVWKQRERRWLNRGSSVHKALLLAYEKKRPIIGMLPPVIQAQLEHDSAHAASTSEEESSNA